MNNQGAFKNYLILIGVMLVVFTLLIYLSIVSKKSWNNNLKTAVEVVLDEKQPNTWSVGKNIEINNPFTMSGACYEARNRKNGEVYKVMVIRVVTNYGPMAGVFSVDKVNNVDFIGFSNLHGRIEKQVLFLQKVRLVPNQKQCCLRCWQSVSGCDVCGGRSRRAGGSKG